MASGGVYSAMLEMSKTSVLIVSAPEGDKYTHACKWRIKCLTPDWIYDSVQRGHALQMEGYEVKKQKHSTPINSRVTTGECCVSRVVYVDLRRSSLASGFLYAVC